MRREPVVGFREAVFGGREAQMLSGEGVLK